MCVRGNEGTGTQLCISKMYQALTYYQYPKKPGKHSMSTFFGMKNVVILH